MKDWLIARGIIKSDAQLQREKLQKLVADNYANSKDTIWSSWKDSDMRQWLIEHGYIRSDAQKTRDELVHHMNKYYYHAKVRSIRSMGHSKDLILSKCRIPLAHL